MKHYIGAGNPMRTQFDAKAAYQAKHFAWRCSADGVGTLTLNRPERKNPLTFDSYAELRNLFEALKYATDVKVVVVTGAGGNFCSGGDVRMRLGRCTFCRESGCASKFCGQGCAGGDHLPCSTRADISIDGTRGDKDYFPASTAMNSHII